jgi:hypothetical protein
MLIQIEGVAMSIFLTRDEVIELTGRKQRQKQIEQLCFLQLPFVLDALGWPKVLRRAVERELALVEAGRNDGPATINYERLAALKGA